ncbi:MAG: cellulase family glycosylhydrolase [Acidimicrobiales bacterium]|nr:cellulase family glycosylhydrolase [Acidimicrobiales bacterium]
MTRRRRSLLIGVLLVLGLVVVWHSIPVPADAVQSPLPGPVSGWSTTIGTDGRVYLADAQGRARQFHGANHKTTDPDTLTDELLADAAERGLDHIRLSIYWDALEPVDDVFDDVYLDRFIAAMDRAAAHGLLVIIDMHQDVYGPAFGSRGIPEWATRTDGVPFVPQSVWLLNYLQPAVQNAFEHLYEDGDLRADQMQVWLHVVDRVKGHPALLGYDLLNEPFGKFRPGEDFLTAAARVERTQLTPMYQRLTDAISAVDPDHWVFVEPPNLASLGVPSSLGPVAGPKVAVYPHMYDAAIEAATYTPGGVVQYDPTFFDKWFSAASAYPATYRVPLLVGEWGVAHPTAPGMDAFIRDSLVTLDRVGSGWSVFNWCRGDGYCPIDASGNDRPGIAQIFQPYARAIAGAPTFSRWDAASRVLTVQYTDNAANGPTEIFIPESRSYPDGWEVRTTAPPGAWTSTFDPATGVLSVTVERTGGSHAICVLPVDSPQPCDLYVPPAPAPRPPLATSPILATPAFTG